MPTTAAKFRTLAIVGFMLAVVGVPWARTAPVVSAPMAMSACCCDNEGPCCCATQAGGGGSTEADLGQGCCSCGEQPLDRGNPWLMLLMTGITPVCWQPAPMSEAVPLPLVPNAPAPALAVRVLPVPSTAVRLARLGVRTT